MRFPDGTHPTAQPHAGNARLAESTPWRMSLGGYAPILLLVLLGFATTWALVLEVTRLDRERVQTAFSAAARDRVLVVQRELQSSLNVVQDVGSFFDANPDVRRSQFREFVQPVLKRDQGIQSLEWVPRVAAEGRAVFELFARAGFPRFKLVDHAGAEIPIRRHGEHFPLLFAHPYIRDTTPLGLDFSTLPREMSMLESARHNRRVQITQGLGVAPQSSGRAEFTVYLPVFEQSIDDEEPFYESDDYGTTETFGPLRGFAIGRFLVADIVNRALSNLSPSGVDIELQFAAADGQPRTLYVHNSRILGPETPFPEEVDTRQQVFNIDIAGNVWTLVCSSVPGSFQSGVWSAGLVLSGGVAFTLLLAAYMYTLIGRAEKVKRLVSLSTLELEHSNQALNRQVVERLKAEQALQTLNRTLEQRVAMRAAEAERRAAELEQFAYVTSHDLKAPLRAIANLATWLVDDLNEKLTSETREQLDLMRDRVGRMHGLVEGLLTYSRIGRVDGERERVDTRAMIAELVDSIAPPPGFRIEVAKDLPDMYTDRLQLGQVFSNLIGNGIKHHHKDAGRIDVTGRDQGSHYEFSVSDDGPGIPTEYHEKVFKMFQTLKVKDYGGDTGIGLALVKKIVEEHGGVIKLMSTEGKGTTIYFTWLHENKDPLASESGMPL